MFADNSAGNGYGDGNALVELDGHGDARVLAVRTVAATFPAVGAPGFPTQVYPPARPARGGHLPRALAPKGLSPSGTAPFHVARGMALEYNSDDMLDLQDTDRSWWEGDFDLLDSQAGTGNTAVVSLLPASRDSLCRCGERFVAGPSSSATRLLSRALVDSFAVGHLYFLDRRGHPLVYFEAS